MTDWPVQDAKNLLQRPGRCRPHWRSAAGDPPGPARCRRAGGGRVRASLPPGEDERAHAGRSAARHPRKMTRSSTGCPSAGRLMFLLDTDVLSALRRRERHPAADPVAGRPANGRPVPECSDRWRDRTQHRATATPRPVVCGGAVRLAGPRARVVRRQGARRRRSPPPVAGGVCPATSGTNRRT